MGSRNTKNTDSLSIVVSEALDENTVFPYDIDQIGLGLSVINNDPANTLEFSIVTRKNLTIGPIKVPPRVSLNELYPEFKKIIMNTSTVSFDMLVKISDSNF